MCASTAGGVRPGSAVVTRGPGITQSIRAFFTGAGLPVFVLSAVSLYEAFLIAIVFAPEVTGAWGDFAREFKLWCFDYDPRTGGMSWATAWVMLLEPLFLAGIVVLLWRRALGGLRSPRLCLGQSRSALGGVIVAACAIGGLYAYGRPASEAEPVRPFPGERIRTQLPPPSFQVRDQAGRAFSLEDVRGRVVLITGIYAMCASTCPEILAEIRTLLAELPADNRARLSVVAFSLNPEYETTELMTAYAGGHGMVYPEFRYVNGAPAMMHDLLTRFQFSPVRNSRTGTIDHANLFILVDAQGAIAYRFNLDPRHRSWLRDAVLALTNEAGARS